MNNLLLDHKALITREEWLVSGVELLQDRVFKQADLEIPNDVKVACGFPSSNAKAGKNQAVGVCHPRSHSEDKVNEIFINPCESDSLRVLDVLAHELIHAIDDCKNGHKKRFKDMAVAVGLTGKMTATVATPELEEILQKMVAEIGKYPHAKIDTSQKKKQTTRQKKVECSSCEGIFYTSRKHLQALSDYSPCPFCSETGTLNFEGCTVEL